MDKAKVSFIVVNWNTKELTKQCISSLLASYPIEKSEIILVDNGSADGSIPYLSEHFKDIKIIQNTDNLGFAKANNQALVVASGEFSVLVNSDVVVNKHAIETTLNFLKSYNEVAVVGCNLITGSSGVIQKFSFGYAPTLGRIFNQFLGTFYLSRYIPILRGITACSVNEGRPIPVDWVSGAYLALRMEAYRNIGSMNENYFFYIEDMEWCVRFRRKGYKIYFMPQERVIHFLGSSQKTMEQRSVMVCNWYKNLHSYFAEEHSKSKVFLFDIFAILGFGSRLIFSCIKSIFWKKNYRFEEISNRTIVKTAFHFLFK